MDYEKIMYELVGDAIEIDEGKMLKGVRTNYCSNEIKSFIIINIKRRINIVTWTMGHVIFGKIKNMVHNSRSIYFLSSLSSERIVSLSSFKRLEIAESILEEL